MMKEIKNGVQPTDRIFIQKFWNKGLRFCLKKYIMSVNERLQKILIDLEDSISYKDWDMVESAKDELTFLIDDIDEGEYPNEDYDDEY